jgi:hypothetical protein
MNPSILTHSYSSGSGFRVQGSGVQGSGSGFKVRISAFEGFSLAQKRAVAVNYVNLEPRT